MPRASELIVFAGDSIEGDDKDSKDTAMHIFLSLCQQYKQIGLYCPV